MTATWPDCNHRRYKGATACTQCANHDAAVQKLLVQRKVVTCEQLHDVLAEAIKEGKGGWPVMLQKVERGVTHADPVIMAFSAQVYDGEVVWIVVDEKSRIANANANLF